MTRAPLPLLHRVRDDARAWCTGRLAIVRIPVLFFFAWTWMQHASDPLHESIFKGINLGIHELGHVLFRPTGDIVEALGGSIAQCLAPFIAAAMFFRQRDYFAIAFCFGWLATNLFEVAAYADDAVAKSLHLVTPGGGEPIHDWNYVLASMGWLRHTEEIAAAHRALAHLSMTACLVFGGWLVLTMMRQPARAQARTAPHPQAPEPASAPTATGTRSPRE